MLLHNKGCHPYVPMILVVKKLIYSRTRNNTSSLTIANPKFSNCSLISDFLDLKLIMKLGPNLNLRSYLKSIGLQITRLIIFYNQTQSWRSSSSPDKSEKVKKQMLKKNTELVMLTETPTYKTLTQGFGWSKRVQRIRFISF